MLWLAGGALLLTVPRVRRGPACRTRCRQHDRLPRAHGRGGGGDVRAALATVVRSATSPDGHVDWAPIKDTAASLKTPAAQCVLAAVIKEALTPPRRARTRRSPRRRALDEQSLLVGWEAQRSEWGGARYQLAGGTL